MKKATLILFAVSFAVSLSAQKVGLVFSGGGAKGITHVGVIKALEENNIPIDYVVGTSMGAIVSSLYAMGMSPDEMIALLKSDSFHRWSMGILSTDEKYFYFDSDPRPSIFNISLSFNPHAHNIHSIDIKAKIPPNFIPSSQMNLAFLELFARANAVAGGDFDRLFVPFRCVASDVYHKKAVVLSKGNLGDAVRTSMSIPLVYKPIEIDELLLLDGGIYNNFPVDVMRADFHPDYLIGSDVHKNFDPPDKNDVSSQILHLLISSPKYNLPETQGIILEFDTQKFDMFNFRKVDELVQMGYDSTIVHIEEIRKQVHRQQDAAALAKKRADFKQKYPALEFQNIIITGIDTLQQQYIKHFLQDKDEVFTFEDFRKYYFMLLSDVRIKEIIPHATFDETTGKFNLTLNVSTQEPLTAHAGGNISSSTSNQVYFGLTYQQLRNYALTANFDAQFGNFYNGISSNIWADIPAKTPYYLELRTVWHRFSFLETSKWFYEYDTDNFNFIQNELYGKFVFGTTFNLRGRFECGIGYGFLTDYYQLTPRSLATSTRKDENRYLLSTAYLRYENYTLENITFPISGYKYDFSAQLLSGNQSFRAATAKAGDPPEKSKDTWFQFHAQYENYTNIGKRFILGTHFEADFSTRKLLNNYSATLTQAPAFAPTAHSKTIFNAAFRANQFAAVGVKPIVRISDQLYWRNELYGFLPFQKIEKGNQDKAVYRDFSFNNAEFLAESSFVFYFQRVSVGLFANRYSHAVSPWNFGANIGFLIFNDRFIY